MKNQDAICKALSNRGFDQVKSTSRKYKKFETSNPDIFYFVGKSGALRLGNNVSNSISRSNNTFHFQLLSEGKRL